MFFLFDFDGTMVDSFHTVVEKGNLLAEQYHFRKVENHEIEDLRHMSSREIVRFLEIPFYKIPKLMPLMRQQLLKEMPGLSPITHMPQIIEKLHQAKCTMGILTSNSVENVTIWLEAHNLRQYFKFIHIESNYFSKGYLLKKTLKKYQIDKSKAFYIGDETRDIEAAKKNDIQSIAVTWGYNSEKALAPWQPTYIVQKPEELLRIAGID